MFKKSKIIIFSLKYIFDLSLIKLLDIPTSMCYSADSANLKQYLQNYDCRFYLPDTIASLDSIVVHYKAVISQTSTLVNQGDFVKLTDSNVGVLINCQFMLYHGLGIFWNSFNNFSRPKNMC